MRRATLYICYYHITEPLVETQVIAYLRELARQGFEVHLLTFERESLSFERCKIIRAAMKRDGIYWHSLRYHQRPSLPATVFDIANGTWAALRICQKHKIGLVHARSHVAAAMAMNVKRLLRCRFLFDIRGLLAEEYVDAGHWIEGGIKYRLTKCMEQQFYRNADAFIVLTHRIKSELIDRELKLSRSSRGYSGNTMLC